MRQYSGKGRYDIVDKKMRTGEDTYGSYGNRTISGAYGIPKMKMEE